MPTHLALLRGINVGGHNRVAMADLRRVAASLGHADVATYIQSGNVVFTSRDADTGALARALERAIAETLDVRPAVVVLSREDLRQVVADNPFPEVADPKHLHAVFGDREPGPARVAEVRAAQDAATARGSPDEARIVGRTLFLHTPEGIGRSELAARLTRTPRGAREGAGTARNWATVTRLLKMVEA